VIEIGFSDSGSITRPTSPSPSSIFVSSFAARKVQMSDFEVIRVLGKGCAGKVLLVRHKSSSRLYALKAIIKRHVLAHQDLQHTLTEQAVLRRMAAEGTDPFVVKLWWSFHDKENLFLVMVRLPCIHHGAQCSQVSCCYVL
jgi:serine/threonine protein kinase